VLNLIHQYGFLPLLQLSVTDLRSFGWAFAIFSGFGVKIAYEISERMKHNQPFTQTYWIGNGCAIFITYVVGFYSRALITHFSDSSDVQAGLFAIVGAVGFELFKIFYRIVTNRKLWEQFVGVLMNRYAASPYQQPQNQPANEPDNN
jgi:hypothetical protein